MVRQLSSFISKIQALNILSPSATLYLSGSEVRNLFIEASLFDDLSGNVAEAEKAFMSEENGLSLQENLFNQSEINNAEDRKKKC